jgi:ribosomal protein S8
MKVEELKNLTAGRSANRLVHPLQPGEIAIIKTSSGILEIKEAIEQNVGGEVLCRAI